MSYINSVLLMNKQQGIPTNAVYKQVVMEHKEDDRVEKQEAQMYQMEQDHAMWRQRYFKLESQYDKVRALAERSTQLDDRIHLLRADNQNLSQLLREKATECEQMRVKVSQLELENFEMGSMKLEITKLTSLLEQRNAEAAEQRNRLTILQNDLLKESENQLIIEDYRIKTDYLTKDVELWKNMYKEMDKERLKHLEVIKQLEFLPEEETPIEAAIEEPTQVKERTRDLDALLQQRDAQIVDLNDHLGLKDKNTQKLLRELENKGRQLNEMSLKNTQMEGALRQVKVLTLDNQKLKDQKDNKHKEMEQFRKSYYSTLTKLQLAEEQLQQLVDLQNKVQMLQSELQQVKVALKDKNIEVESLNNNIKLLKSELDTLRGLDELKTRLEGNITQLTQENKKLLGQVKQQEESAGEYVKKCNQLQNSNADLQGEIKKLQLKDYSGIQQQGLYITELQGKIGQLEAEHSQYQGQVANLKTKLDVLGSELQRISTLLIQRNKELSEAQKKIEEYEASTVVQDLKLVIQKQKADLTSNQLDNEQLKLTILKLEQQLNDAKIQTQQSDANCQSAENEKSKVDTILQSYLQQIKQLEADLDLYRRLQLQFKELQTKHDLLNKQVAVQSKHLEEYQQQFLDLSKENEKLTIDNATLNSKISVLSQVQKEVQALKTGLDSSKDDYNKQSQQMVILNKDLNDALSMKNTLENKLAMLSTEVERFQYKLNSRTTESEELKKKILTLETQISELQQLENENAQLHDRVDQLQQEVADMVGQNWEIQLKNNLTENEQLQIQIASLSKKVDLLDEQSKKADLSYEQLKKQYQSTLNENNDYKTQLQAFKTIEKKLNNTQEDCQRLLDQVADLKQQNNQLVHENQQLSTQITQLSVQLADTQNQLEKATTANQKGSNYEALIKQLQDQIDKLQDEKYKLENKVALLSSEIERLRVKYETQNAKLEEIRQEQEGAQREYEHLQKVFEEAQNEIEILSKEAQEGNAIKRKEQEWSIALMASLAEVEALRGQMQKQQEELIGQRKSNIKLAAQ